MATISILANTVRPSVNHRLDDTAFGVGTLSWQDPVHSWKGGPGEVMYDCGKQKRNKTTIMIKFNYWIDINVDQ